MKQREATSGRISVRVRDGELPVNAKRGYWADGPATAQ
jgi:hypothetical protein